jgi:hypothetical protein
VTRIKPGTGPRKLLRARAGAAAITIVAAGFFPGCNLLTCADDGYSCEPPDGGRDTAAADRVGDHSLDAPHDAPSDGAAAGDGVGDTTSDLVEVGDSPVEADIGDGV